MRKKIYGIATALTLAMGCSLFMTYPVQAAETQDIQQEESDYFTLPNGKKFLAIRKLKNGKTVKFYDLHAYTDGKAVYGKAIYDGEEFQVRNFDLELDKGDFENPGYKENDKSTQKFSAYGKPETYFPALTATKKVNDLINTYKDPSKHLLSEKVDKTTTVYKEMEAAAKEATKNCKTDYEKIITLTKYVKSIMTYDISLAHKGWSMEQAWNSKKGVCEQFGEIMQRLVQIEGIPSVAVGWENTNNYYAGHMYVLSYDKDSKKWICSDPTAGNTDLSVYSQAGQMTNVNQNVSFLKNNNAYFRLIYDKNVTDGSIDYDTWDLIDKWGLVLQTVDDTYETDISVDNTELEGIPIVGIGENALYNDTKINSLSLPSSIERVKSGAFWKASNLKNVTFADKGKGLKTIGMYAFADCSSLESIDLSNSSITEIPKNAFSNCTSLKTVKLPPTVTKIADDAFANCKKLEEIQGLSNCKISEIGKDAFAGCYNLKTFDISSATITSLPDTICSNMYALTSIHLPKTLTSIGTSALEGCKKLEEINGLSDCKLTSIGANAFASCSALKEVDLSKSSFTALPTSAFAKDTALTSVKLPDSLTEIGEKAFVGCGAMEKIDLSNTKLTTIGKNAMAEMNDLMYINLPDTVKNVGQSAFDISVPLDSSDTAFMPTIISENVNPLDVGYTDNNISPWKRRQVIFRDNAFTVRFDGNGSDGTTANEPFFGYVGTKVTINNTTDNMILYAKWSDSHTHSWDSGVVTKQPTCTEAGTKTYTCTSCGKTKTTEIAATGHQHTEIRNKKEATCKAEGYTGDTYCTDCETKVSSGQAIPKTDHTWDNGKVTTEATCEHTGVRTYICSVCGETKEEETPKTDHTYDDGTVTKKPTCIETGIKTYTCTVCQKTKTEEIPAIGHQHTEIRNKKEATCKAEGYTGDMYCKDCGEKLSDGKTIAKTTEHTWDAGKVTKAATCTEKGVKTYTCTVCGATKTEEIAATGHQHTEVRNKVEATCTKEGYSGDTYCTDCGEKLSSGTEIARKAHEYEERERNEANCKRNGYILFVCKVCGDEKREVLPKTDHQHTEIRNKVEATCTDEGYTGDTYCTDCGEKLSDGKKIPATGHIHIGYLGKKEATCENDGYTGDAYCKDCGITLKIGKNIPALGHTWEKKSVISPTYTKKGTITYICKRCKEKKAVTTKKLAYPKVGTRYTVSGSTYKVTKAGAEVMVYKTSKVARSVIIPATIKAKGITYKVTAIGTKAFNGNKKLKKVTIGANIKKISNNAFFKCPALKTVTVKTMKLTKKTAGKKAFKGVNRKMVIKVPKKVKKAYVKIFKRLKVK